jgi:hypothetical protein
MELEGWVKTLIEKTMFVSRLAMQVFMAPGMSQQKLGLMQEVQTGLLKQLQANFSKVKTIRKIDFNDMKDEWADESHLAVRKTEYNNNESFNLTTIKEEVSVFDKSAVENSWYEPASSDEELNPEILCAEDIDDDLEMKRGPWSWSDKEKRKLVELIKLHGSKP